MKTDPTQVPELDGVLSRADVLATAASIAAVQRPDGMIPWFPGGHSDPWNHVEAAMALTVAGFRREADRAYEWLAGSQLADGSWFNYYVSVGVKDPRLDTNVCAYVAAGAWHHFLATGDEAHLASLWPTVERAIDFVLRWQRVDGAIRWSLDGAGRLEEFGLLTGSSSIYHSLRCAVRCAEHLGHERPDWEWAAGRLAHAVAHETAAFLAKDEFAMDWYYPVLSGAVTGDPARGRLREGWSTFVMDGIGVRCVSTGDWVTAAETAECVMALDAVGMDAEAVKLLSDVQILRRADGSYWTGMAYPMEQTFPPDERATYTAAAVILAVDALARTTPTSGLFRGEGLPSHLDLTEPAPDAPVESPAGARDGGRAGSPAPHPR